ncbi:MAG TPA: acetoacetate--CoA ligase [Acidimicrobiia bacterium]
MSQPLWTPSPERVEASALRGFIAAVDEEWDAGASDFPSLHRWSVEHPERFWSTVWRFTGVTGEAGDTVVEPSADLWRTRFFPDASLNFAANLLRRRDDGPAMLAAREDGGRGVTTWGQLAGLVSRVQQALGALGVEAGDRVAAWMPNAPEAYALMLATASVGAVFSSCSPDFGVDGVVDRFGQIEPTVLVAVDAYLYGGKRFDCLQRLAAVVRRLPSVRAVVVLGYVEDDPDLGAVPGAVAWHDWLASHPAGEPEFALLPFDQPLYILYSSGTTGAPKCIVHRAGGVLLKLLSEHRLHCDIRAGDRVFYFTTTGWMMWNWLASTLACEATAVVYDGVPVLDGRDQLWDLADELDMTLFGTSARYLEACRKAGLAPIETHELTSLRTITSTGSPLAPEGFEYVYARVKSDVHLASISGGTDLCGCLVAGDPTSPVWAGEIQRPGLAMDIDFYDEAGARCAVAERGELVCRSAFPSVPLRFWADDGDTRFRAAYFERFPGVWHQGDFGEWTEHGGVVIHGRSDATLNPGGVRIGTAEIYRQVEQLDEIVECLAVGQEWEGDTRIVLFVVPAAGVTVDDDLGTRIRDRVRSGASPRHVPAKIVAVTDIPRTRSGKLSEIAVRDVVHGRDVKNVEALANAEALEQFRDLPVLRT